MKLLKNKHRGEIERTNERMSEWTEEFIFIYLNERMVEQTHNYWMNEWKNKMHEWLSVWLTVDYT